MSSIFRKIFAILCCVMLVFGQMMIAWPAVADDVPADVEIGTNQDESEPEAEPEESIPLTVKEEPAPVVIEEEPAPENEEEEPAPAASEEETEPQAAEEKPAVEAEEEAAPALSEEEPAPSATEEEPEPQAEEEAVPPVAEEEEPVPAVEEVEEPVPAVEEVEEPAPETSAEEPSPAVVEEETIPQPEEEEPAKQPEEEEPASYEPNQTVTVGSTVQGTISAGEPYVIRLSCSASGKILVNAEADFTLNLEVLNTKSGKSKIWQGSKKDGLKAEINGKKGSVYDLIFTANSGNDGGSFFVAISEETPEQPAEETIVTPAETVPEEQKPETKPAETVKEPAAKAEEPAQEPTGGTEPVTPEEPAEVPATEEETEEYYEGYLLHKGNDYTVRVRIKKNARLPLGITLQVSEIQKGTAEYRKLTGQANGALKGQDEEIDGFARFFDISFVLDGTAYEPDAPVNVQITFSNAVEVDEGCEVQTIHFDEKGPELIGSDTSSGGEGQVKSVKFSSDDFSVYGVVVKNGVETNSIPDAPVIQITEENGKKYIVWDKNFVFDYCYIYIKTSVRSSFFEYDDYGQVNKIMLPDYPGDNQVYVDFEIYDDEEMEYIYVSSNTVSYKSSVPSVKLLEENGRHYLVWKRDMGNYADFDLYIKYSSYWDFDYYSDWSYDWDEDYVRIEIYGKPGENEIYVSFEYSEYIGYSQEYWYVDSDIITFYEKPDEPEFEFESSRRISQKPNGSMTLSFDDDNESNEYITGYEVKVGSGDAIKVSKSKCSLAISATPGETVKVKIRGYVNTGSKLLYSDYVTEYIYIPSMPTDFEITRSGDNYYLSFTGDPESYYKLFYKHPGDSNYSSSGSVKEVEYGTNKVKLKIQRPSNYGKNWIAIRIYNGSCNDETSFSSSLQGKISYTVVPYIPDSFYIRYKDQKTDIVIKDSKNTKAGVDGYEVLYNGKLLPESIVSYGDTITTVQPISAKLAEGKTVKVKVRAYVMHNGKKMYSAYKTQSIYIPKMPSDLSIVKSDGYSYLTFKGDTKAYYQLSKLYPDESEYSSWSSKKAIKKTNRVSLSKGIPGKHRLKIRVVNSTSKPTFYGYCSGSVSYSTGPNPPDEISFYTYANGKLKITVENDSVADGIQVYMNGEHLKSFTCKKSKSTYEFDTSLIGVKGKAVDVTARTFKKIGGKTYYSGWSHSGYITASYPEYEHCGLGARVTWDLSNGAEHYDVYLERYIESTGKTVVYAKKKDAKPGVYLKNNVNAACRIRIVAWSIVNGERIEETAYTSFTPYILSPNIHISNTRNSITVSWEKTPGIDGYEIYRSMDFQTGYTKIADIKGNSVTSYTDTAVTSGRDYYYKVRVYCINSKGSKMRSDFSAREQGQIYRPTRTTLAISPTMTSLILKWDAVDCDGYEVWRFSDTEDYTLIASLPRTATSFTNTTTGSYPLKANKVYYYELAPYYNAIDEGFAYRECTYSNTVSDSLRPAPPTGIKVKKKTTNSAVVSWNAVNGATQYEVWMRTESPEADKKKVSTVTSTATTVKGLTKGQTYYFIIRAIAGTAKGDFTDNIMYTAK